MKETLRCGTAGHGRTRSLVLILVIADLKTILFFFFF